MFSFFFTPVWYFNPDFCGVVACCIDQRMYFCVSHHILASSHRELKEEHVNMMSSFNLFPSGLSLRWEEA